MCGWNPRKHTLYQYIVLKGEGEREGKNKSKDRIVEWRRWLAWRSSFNSLTKHTQLKTVCVYSYVLMPIHCYGIIFSYIVFIISSYNSSRMLLTKIYIYALHNERFKIKVSAGRSDGDIEWMVLVTNSVTLGTFGWSLPSLDRGAENVPISRSHCIIVLTF